MRFIFLFISLFTYWGALSQSTAVITGTVSNAVWKEVSVEIDRTYLDNTSITESTTLNENSKFSFELEINIPQLIIFEYARNRHSVYIEPGGNLDIEFDANSFNYSMKFGGSCGKSNDFLREFNKRFPEETNKFLMKHIKKGIYYYETDETLERKMKTLGPAAFSSEMNNLKTKKEFMLEQFESKNGFLTDLFTRYIQAEIQYDWAFRMMMYGYSFKNLHNIEESFFQFVEKVTLRNDDALGNEKYRKFLVGYINMVFDKSGRSGNPYVGQYEMAPELVSDASLAFFQADILVRGFKKNEMTTMLPTYNEFVKTVPYNEFYLRAVDAYFQKKQYAIGSPAPSFTLKNSKGEMVSLEDFRGKVVVMNFWASWCRPCINKIEEAKTVQRWVNSDEIVFLNISLERKEEYFVEEIVNRNLGGMVNVFAKKGLESEITKAYEVKAIPEFFIISKMGTFARKPQKTDPYSLSQHLGLIIN